MARKLRELARGQQCQLRLCEDDGTRICNFTPSTVVLCHVRRGGVAGIAQKPVDLCALYACSDCHDCMDGRRKHSITNIDGDILDGVCRTLTIVSKELGL